MGPALLAVWFVATAVAVFSRWGIRRLYGSYGALPVEMPERMAAWNRRLHAAGIRSETLFADGTALTPAGRGALLRQIDERVLPEVEAATATGIDLENYELLRIAEAAAGR